MTTETSSAEKSPQGSHGLRVVDEAYAVRLQERFGIPTAFVLRALKGQPRQRAVALCRLATRYRERNGTLLMLAHRFGTGRALRRRTATKPPRGHEGVSPRPSVDRSGPDRDRDTAAPQEVASAHRDGFLPGIPDPEMLDAPAARLGP